MVGKIQVRTSFAGALQYVLHDKKLEQQEEQKLRRESRTEVLQYNRCFGDAKELEKQMQEVRALNSRTEKPVFSMSLRASEKDRLSKEQWRQIGEKLAREFGAANNQYIVVLHKDTEPNHIHVIANRVGYDGKCAEHFKDYERMAKFCRRVEKEYNLQPVLSPKRFLSKEEKLLPRHDQRKEKLKRDIEHSLKESRSIQEFVQSMKAKHYEVIKQRGIAFRDREKVYAKGSEVGYALNTIEQKLEQKLALEKEQKQSINRSR
jgi:hypothetical protein